MMLKYSPRQHADEANRVCYYGEPLAHAMH
jgi:hypothetical protein